MTFLIVLGIYFAALFGLFFFGRRHVGMPALGLTAGAVLAHLWTDSLTPIVAEAGLNIDRPPLHSMVSVALTILPAALVMLRSAKAHSGLHKIYSSLVFAVLAVMLTYGAFANAFVIDEASKDYVIWLVSYENIIITVGVVLALIDVVYHKKSPQTKKKKSK